MYKIGEFSELTGLSVKTLRYYDEIGILKPGSVDDFTGYRYYTSENLNTVRIIEELKSCNFKLEEIKYVLDNGLSVETIDAKQEELSTTINELYNAYNFLDGIKEGLQVQNNITNGVKVKKLISGEKKTM